MRITLQIAELTAACMVSGCVSFDRFAVVQNQPLTAPMEAQVVSVHEISLKDGRTIRFVTQLDKVTTGQNVQVEISAAEQTSHSVTVYFKKPVPAARNWKSGPELEIPFSTHKIPAFERALLGVGVLEPSKSATSGNNE